MGSNINYNEFLSKLEFEFEKYRIIDFIFVTLQAAMQKLNATNLYDLFSKFDVGGMRQFDKTTLNKTLTNLGMYLSQFEYDMVILDYDQQGSG